jgi:hypothetical protein
MKMYLIGAIAQGNQLSDCGFRSLTESELEVGG